MNILETHPTVTAHIRDAVTKQPFGFTGDANDSARVVALWNKFHEVENLGMARDMIEQIASWKEYGDAPDVEDMRNVLNWAIRTAKEILPPPQGVPCDCGSGAAYWDGPDHSRRYACESCHERGKSSFVIESAGRAGTCLVGEGGTSEQAWVDAFGHRPWTAGVKASAKLAWVREVSPAELEELHAEAASR